MSEKRLRLVLIFGLTSFASAQNSAPIVSVTRWPQDLASAISLSFDDGINTHLDVVGPILKKHHLNATFFVTTGMGPWEKRKAEWKELAEGGNELANHTVHHPCMLPQITPHSQDYTPEMMEAEIREAAQEISKLVPKQRGLTFAYPCGNMSFGKPTDEVKNAALYLRYVSEHAFGARAVGQGGANPDELNVLAINDLGATAGQGIAGLLDLAQPALRSHNWGVYCFHGVGGDWLSITPEALEGLTDYLERHAEIWTATFGDVLRYIQERKAASVQITGRDANSVSVSMTWPMDKQIFDLPLTLRVEVPKAWKEATAMGDGKQLPVRIRDGPNGSVVLVDVPSQTTAVRVARRP